MSRKKSKRAKHNEQIVCDRSYGINLPKEKHCRHAAKVRTSLSSFPVISNFFLMKSMVDKE